MAGKSQKIILGNLILGNDLILKNVCDSVEVAEKRYLAKGLDCFVGGKVAWGGFFLGA